MGEHVRRGDSADFRREVGAMADALEWAVRALDKAGVERSLATSVGVAVGSIEAFARAYRETAAGVEE